MSEVIRKSWLLWTFFFAVAAVFLIAAGCGDDDDDDDDNDDDDNDDTGDDDDDDLGDAYIRAIHLSRDTPGVDVYVNQTIQAFTNLEFPDSSDYAMLEEGTYRFDVTPTGSSVDDAALTIEALPLEADTYYTAVAFDDLATIQPLALVDDLSDPGTDMIRVRAIHTAKGVGEVDIWEVSDAENPVALYTDVNFGDVGDYAVLPAAAYTLGFDVDNDEVPDLVFETPELASGTIANIFAVADSEDAVFLIAQLGGDTTAKIDPTVK